MIDSATDLVTDLVDELCSPTPSNSIIKKQKDSNNVIETSKYLNHQNCLQTYFLRMSSMNKLKFLSNLIEKVRSVGSISLLLNTLYTESGKMSSYVKISVEIDYIYDRIIEDHNRMLDDKVLEGTLEEDVEWFANLSDRNQISTLIPLLRFGGGSIMSKFYRMLEKTYKERLKEGHKQNVIEKEIETIVGEQPPRRASVRKSKVLEDFDLEAMLPKLMTKHDPNDPLHKKCENLTKEYNATIAKYKKQIGFDKAQKEKKEKKAKKKDKSSKKSNSKKSSKKKKKAKKPKTDYADRIQTLPIWIVKKIFDYLDKKTLNKAKKVNEYWAWVIKDLNQSYKYFKIFEKTKQKIDASIDYSCIDPGIVYEPPKRNERISFVDKRMKKLQKRGAILENMRHTDLPQSTHCLLAEAIKICPEQYLGFGDDTVMFPRAKKQETRLYKTPTHIVKDLNIICKEVSDTEKPNPHVDFSVSTYTQESDDSR